MILLHFSLLCTSLLLVKMTTVDAYVGARAIPTTAEYYIYEKFRDQGIMMKVDETNYLTDLSAHYNSTCQDWDHSSAYTYFSVKRTNDDFKNIKGLTSRVKGDRSDAGAALDYIKRMIPEWLNTPLFSDVIQNSNRFGCSCRPGCSGYFILVCLFDNFGKPPVRPHISTSTTTQRPTTTTTRSWITRGTTTTEVPRLNAYAFDKNQTLYLHKITGWNVSDTLATFSGLETHCSMIGEKIHDFTLTIDYLERSLRIKNKIKAIFAYVTKHERRVEETPAAIAHILNSDKFAEIRSQKGDYTGGCSLQDACNKRAQEYHGSVNYDFVISCLYVEGANLDSIEKLKVSSLLREKSIRRYAGGNDRFDANNRGMTKTNIKGMNNNEKASIRNRVTDKYNNIIEEHAISSFRCGLDSNAIIKIDNVKYTKIQYEATENNRDYALKEFFNSQSLDSAYDKSIGCAVSNCDGVFNVYCLYNDPANVREGDIQGANTRISHNNNNRNPGSGNRRRETKNHDTRRPEVRPDRRNNVDRTNNRHRQRDREDNNRVRANNREVGRQTNSNQGNRVVDPRERQRGQDTRRQRDDQRLREEQEEADRIGRVEEEKIERKKEERIEREEERRDARRREEEERRQRGRNNDNDRNNDNRRDENRRNDNRNDENNRRTGRNSDLEVRRDSHLEVRRDSHLEVRRDSDLEVRRDNVGVGHTARTPSEVPESKSIAFSAKLVNHLKTVYGIYEYDHDFALIAEQRANCVDTHIINSSFTHNTDDYEMLRIVSDEYYEEDAIKEMLDDDKLIEMSEQSVGCSIKECTGSKRVLACIWNEY